jgi:transmembrane sensor
LLREAPLDRIGEFRIWLAKDERHAAAWARVQTAWYAVDRHAISAALVHHRQNALAFVRRAAMARAASRWGRKGWTVGIGVAAAILLVMGSTLWSIYRFDVYRTVQGERRVFTLSDGSEIALDSASEVRVRYGRHSRELALAAGQARFNVAHDVLRPFSVQAANQQVVATGTAFNVDLLGPDLVVTMIEGHVVVLRSDPLPNPAVAPRIQLDAGEQLVLSPVSPPSVVRVNVDHAIAWESGALVFDNEPLSKVIRRISRYGGPLIRIADENTARSRISGVFREGDVQGFVDTVVSYLSLQADAQADGSIQLRSAPSVTEKPQT